ncbi:hypothetical protein [Agromyces kandeliae]|uniref:MarR family transcriptional regulator n=1 Tax=Agromyces kandeliae TaxID=2666141 RepID=A0A6L5R039_9MICO|nr:hypothetical protein [Agromyces kandeliae]MRX43371.1 hypothetical protein [Agromyces kandeliae]
MSTAFAPAPVASAVAAPPLVAADTVAPPTPAADATTALAYASIAHGTARGHYRVLFEAGPVDAPAFAALAGVSLGESRRWLAEQLELGLLRPVAATAEVYLPGEFVPVLLDGHGPAALAAPRRLFAEHADELPEVLRTLWTATEDPADHVSRGIDRLWARMFAVGR